MFTLRVGPDWARQIETVRNTVTEDTNLIRFDNGFHRICQTGGDDFAIRLQPHGSKLTTAGITLHLQRRDLYVTRIHDRGFERYASTLDRLNPSAGSLSNAIHQLPRASGIALFEHQSLLVFCVAESLRSDHIATAIGQLIQRSLGGLIGSTPALPLVPLLALARSWGQASDAILNTLSKDARGIVTRPRIALSASELQFSERIDLGRIDPALHEAARAVKVLKRPA